MFAKQLLLSAVVCLAASFSSPALSCSYSLPPRSETAEKIALHGVVIRGTVVRRLDAINHQPVLIQADQIFVGDNVRTYVIESSEREDDLLVNPQILRNSCEHEAYNPQIGHTDIFVLEPAVGRDGVANGMWRLSFFGGDLLTPAAGSILRDAAVRTGRLRSTLPAMP